MNILWQLNDDEVIDKIYYEIFSSRPIIWADIYRFLRRKDYILLGEYSHNASDHETIFTFLWLVLIIEGYED